MVAIMSKQLVFRTGLATLLSAGFMGLVVLAQAHAQANTELHTGAHTQGPTAENARETQTMSAIKASVELEHMTWIEVRDALARGAETIIIPTGGTEQNGPHMVLGKHNFIVSEAARRIAVNLGNALVAPVLGYVPEGPVDARQGHMAFPGTISLRPATFEAVLSDAAASFKTHGFKTIVLLGDSGGNQPSQKIVAERLSAEWAGEGVQVMHVGDYYSANGGDDYLKERGLSDGQIGTHAGIRDTSELMAVLPSGVHSKRAVADADGATGDASLATRDFGEALLSRKVAAGLAQIRNAGKVERREAPAPGVFGYLYSLVFG